MIHYSPQSLSNPVDWNIKRETIFRIFNDVKWMENFFTNGEIMLSCIDKFKNYEDEMQGDKDEGNGIVGGTDEKGNVNAVIYESGLNAYVMSTTTELTEKVKSDFNGKCAIKINNPTLFGLELSKKYRLQIVDLKDIVLTSNQEFIFWTTKSKTIRYFRV